MYVLTQTNIFVNLDKIIQIHIDDCVIYGEKDMGYISFGKYKSPERAEQVFGELGASMMNNKSYCMPGE